MAKKDIQPQIDLLATILINNEVLTKALLEDYDDYRLQMVRNNQKAAHMVAAEVIKVMGYSTDCAPEPPGGK
jgi:hypothetical protein